MHSDVWTNLEQNWNDFFWLTGETPHTLQLLVQQLEPIYRQYYPRRRTSLLSFRNQVIIFNHMPYGFPLMELYINSPPPGVTPPPPPVNNDSNLLWENLCHQLITCKFLIA